MIVKIGTRGSKLALAQTEAVKTALEQAFPDVSCEIVHIVTEGDRVLDRSLPEIGGKGVFTEEIELQLLEGKIDLAVHSAKDLPPVVPAGLTVVPVLKRAYPGDCLIVKADSCEMDEKGGDLLPVLPRGAVIGTSSLRRKAQILKLYPDAEIRSLRGNVDTRLKKLKDGAYRAVILAEAGLTRLHLENDPEIRVFSLPPSSFVPAPGQGILAAETGEAEIEAMLRKISDPEASEAFYAERAYMTALGGNCSVPCGAYFRNEGTGCSMTAFYAPDGTGGSLKTKAIKAGEGICTAEQIAAEMLSGE